MDGARFATTLPRLVASSAKPIQSLAKLITAAGPFTMRLKSSHSPFEALLEAIIYQQLNGRAAATILSRLLGIFGDLHPTPEMIIATPDELFRAAGVSRGKTLALRDLAAKTLDGTVPTLAKIRRMSDEEIIEHLTQVRGIGPWTVEMLLIFRLGRPDVLPVSDYGVRKGFALTFRASQRTSRLRMTCCPSRMRCCAEPRKWRPWRSVASWYLWRACDLAGKASPPPD